MGTSTTGTTTGITGAGDIITTIITGTIDSDRAAPGAVGHLGIDRTLSGIA
jgi:hypothetical protein